MRRNKKGIKGFKIPLNTLRFITNSVSKRRLQKEVEHMGFECLNGQLEHAKNKLDILECWNEYPIKGIVKVFFDTTTGVYESVHLGNYQFKLIKR